MTVLSRTQATEAAQNPAFQARVRSTILDVAVDIHGGNTKPYTQQQYNARAGLAADVVKAPTGYAMVFAGLVAAKEWTGTAPAWVVPGAGDGSDPLIDSPDGDAALRAGIEYVWDTVAGTPEAVV